MSDIENASLITSLYSEIVPPETHSVQVTVQLDPEGNSVINIPEACPAQPVHPAVDDTVTYCYRCGLCEVDCGTYQELVNHLKHHHLGNSHFPSLKGTKNDYTNLKHVIVITGTEMFKCELCGARFAESELAKEHLHAHHGSEHGTNTDAVVDEDNPDLKSNQPKKPFLCNVCGKGFSKQSNVARHKKTHSFKKCDYCEKMFLIDSDLEKHLLSHKEQRTNSDETQVDESKEKGEECFGGIVNHDGTSTSNDNLSTDGTSKEQTSVLEQTQGMKDSQPSAESLIESQSDGDEDFSGNDFDEMTSFGNTEDDGMLVDGKKFKCHVCSKTLNGKQQLNAHMAAHDEQFQCDLCEKVFKRVEDLDDHEATHEGEDLFKCRVCGRTFRQTRHLKLHLKIHVEKFKCDECGETFPTYSSLREHVRTHIESAPFKCDICEKRFTLKSCLRRHYSIHSGEKPHQCKHCDKCFRLASSLHYHKRVHTGEFPLKCDFCDKRFRLSQALKKHVASFHAAVKPYKCDICKKGFVEKGRLTAHRSRIHFGQKNRKKGSSKTDSSDQKHSSFPCFVCKEGLKDSNDLENHLRSCPSQQKENDGLVLEERVDKNEQPKVFLCMKCEKGFSSCEKLLAHMRRHGEPSWLNKSGSCRSTCHVCNKTVNHLQKHLVTHMGLKPFSCEVCGKSFPERYILTKHMKSHSTVRHYECKLCNSAFKRGDNLKRHLKVTHNVDPEKYEIKNITSTKSKTYMCKKCDINFTDEDEFKQHKKNHNEKVPAICSMCGKLFTNMVHLKSHMKIHANWRPYMCETCGKTFTENSQLKKHIRIHTGEKPYSCQFCDKSFSQSCSLNNHMKSHQFVGDTPFKCHLCSASFAYCGELEKHKRGHMGTDVFGCGLCCKKFSHPDDLKHHVDTHLEKPSEQQTDLPSQTGACGADVMTEDMSYQPDPMVTMSYGGPLGGPPGSFDSQDTGNMTVGTDLSGLTGPMITTPPVAMVTGMEACVPLPSASMTQSMNLHHVQALMREAEMMIQNAHQNQ
ncbi:zinc finger protein 271-like [Haliotis rufescens]|uniref:zinc finger protein 271-like n=1 Tax=Haliotis rufescens TaxID=6454 RepID=UPI00201F7AD0|nr:zinc finger protein 271-like [Haliotis rufescens]XP_046365435.2 zinc finger protein 271-like [Haliotis rufescens]